VEYSRYRAGDEPDLVACWNRALPRDQITLRRFIETTLLDDSFCEEGLIEATEQGVLRGFVHAVARRACLPGPGKDGWICALAVDPGSRRQGVASELLSRAEDFLARRGCTRALVSPYANGYYYPGVMLDRYPGSKEVFEKRGYRVQATAVAMDRPLVDYEVPAEVARWRSQLEGQGWRFGAISPRWYIPLIRFCESFSEDWAAIARAALRRDLEPDQIRVATLGDDLGGFAMFGGFDRSVDRFGPVGVQEGLRRSGIGTVLLHETLREMASRSLHVAWFLWTGEEDVAGRMYRRAGFQVTRRFAIYERELG
jgi:mycothiol synthase